MEDLTRPNPGALPSRPDYRADIIASAVAAVSATPTPTLPPALFTDVSRFGYFDQQKTPACVSHAIALLMKIWWFLKTGNIVAFSPRFLHVLSGLKKYNGLADYGPEDGRDPVGVMKIAAKYGCATQAVFSNNTSLSNAAYLNGSSITQAVLDDAINYKIPGYVVTPVTQLGIRQEIQRRGAVALLIALSSAFWTTPNGEITWEQAKIDPVRAPKSSAEIISGHEIVGTGFNTALDHFVNSWGPEWAEHGESDYLFNEWAGYILHAISIAEIPGEALALVQGLPPADEFVHAFGQDMSYGSTGSEIRALQIALSIDGENPYPEVTGYYGDKTRQAVLAFQRRYQLAPEATLSVLNGRNAGPATRNKLNQLFGKKTNPSPIVMFGIPAVQPKAETKTPSGLAKVVANIFNWFKK